MSLRRFVQLLRRPSAKPAAHSGDRLASEIRDTVGPLASGDGHITGGQVYHRLEDRDRS